MSGRSRFCSKGPSLVSPPSEKAAPCPVSDSQQEAPCFCQWAAPFAQEVMVSQHAGFRFCGLLRVPPTLLQVVAGGLSGSIVGFRFRQSCGGAATEILNG